MITETERVLDSLEQLELGQKTLAVKDQLRARLTELAKGREVPFVIFNCLEFSWAKQRRDKYPVATVFCTPNLSICKYFAEEIAIIQLELERLGRPDLRIIVPDSELLDERVFPFAEPKAERLSTALAAKAGLTQELKSLVDTENQVVLWSEYCKTAGLKDPFDYTRENYRRIEKESELQKKVANQVRDSKRFFGKDGIDLSVVRESEIYNRTAWYLAMYMGEGQALAESRAICLNLEDSRVPYWFNEGAQGRLPILNPVDSKAFYEWRGKRK